MVFLFLATALLYYPAGKPRCRYHNSTCHGFRASWHELIAREDGGVGRRIRDDQERRKRLGCRGGGLRRWRDGGGVVSLGHWMWDNACNHAVKLKYSGDLDSKRWDVSCCSRWRPCALADPSNLYLVRPCYQERRVILPMERTLE